MAVFIIVMSVALPLGLIAGIIFRILPRKLRPYIYIIHIVFFFVSLVLANDTKLYSDEMLFTFTMAGTSVVSLATLLSIGIINSLFNFLKSQLWIQKHYKLLIGLPIIAIIIVFIGGYLQDQYIVKKVTGNWYGRKSYDQSLFSHLKISDDGAITFRNQVGEESSNVTFQDITFYNDSIAFFQLWVDNTFLTLIMSRENEQQFFDTPIRYESSYSTSKSERIPEAELIEFWNNNIQAIIQLDKQKIWNQISFPFEGNSISKDNLEIFFSDEMRGGLSKLNYHSVEQLKLENGEINLMIYFLGRGYYGIGTNQDTGQLCYRHFGLIFKKSGTEWLLSSSSNYDECKDVLLSSAVTAKDWQNIEPKSISNIHDEMIANSIWWNTQCSIEKEIVEALLTLNKDKILSNVSFPLQGNWIDSFAFSRTNKERNAENFYTYLASVIESYEQSNEPHAFHFYPKNLTEEHESKIWRWIIPILPIPDLIITRKLNGQFYSNGNFESSMIELAFEKVNGNWKLTSVWNGYYPN